MLYLKSIILDKFKSFRHAELLLSKGFTCVVGPNGSGKSVIFDSLTFCLGEPTLQEMRVDNLGELINRHIKQKPDEPTIAHIKMTFEGDGQTVTVVKAVRSDSKTMYKLNDKTTSRKEVLEYLSSHGVRIDDTTTIAQGQITQIASLNSKGRRELIDTAAGISDFEYKKQEALKELEKVEQKIAVVNTSLGERMSFLRELEKDKENAEKFVKMTQRRKSLRFSILSSRQSELTGACDSYTKEIAIFDSKKGEMAQKIADIDARRNQFNSERQLLQKEFGKMASTSSEVTSKMDNTNGELIRLEVEIPVMLKDIGDAGVFIDQSAIEVGNLKGKIKANADTAEAIAKKIAELEKESAKMGIVPEGMDFEKELKEIDVLITENDSKLIDMQGYISKLQADVSLSKSKKGEAEKRLAEVEQSAGILESRKKDKDSELSETKKKLAETISTLAKLDVENSKLKKRLYDMDGELISLGQQRAVAQSREGNLVSKISDKFGEKDGFYGKAAKLCAYDGKYAYAVEVAASSRFEYLVVDSMAVATKIIDYLKKNNLGRATFIPLSDLNAERQQPKEGSLKSVLDIVTFDKKFAKAFSYIFNNTFIIDDPADAKKFGIGKHRYVTIEGELIEQSGTISGGSQKRISLASIEAKIKDLEEEKDRAKKDALLTETGLNEAGKEKYGFDIQVTSITSEAKAVSEQLASNLKLQSEISRAIKAFDQEAVKIESEVHEKDAEKLGVVSLLNGNREARAAIYDKMEAISKGSKSSKAKESKDKAERLRNELEMNRVNRATMAKETQLFEQKNAELEAAVAERKKQLKEMKAQLSDKELRRDVLAKTKADMEKEIKSRSDSSNKVYTRMSSVDNEMAKLNTDYGKLTAEVSNIERQIGELKIKKGQTEQRLNDIVAELATGEKGLELVKGKIEEMEAEANVLGARITDLGNVNLRAPEMYDEKKKLVDETQSMVVTLKSEEDAVLRMIEQIDSKKLQTFMSMLNDVNKNFGRLYNYVFPGKATIALEDDKDPLNSGIYIRMNDGKSDIPLKSMSGGQKSMVALMLLFSIHLGKKSSIYLFDEVDAALDSENAKILSKLIQELSKDAQFVVISHNSSLIVNADAAIGVSMDEKKESRAIGLEIGSMKGKK